MPRRPLAVAALAAVAVAGGVAVAVWATGDDSSGAPATSTLDAATAQATTAPAPPETTAPPTTAAPETSEPVTTEAPAETTVPETPDVTPPDLVDGVERTGATEDSVTIGWSPARDDRAVTAYAVDRDGVELETVAEPAITIDALPCGTTMTVGVRAMDDAGNQGLRAAASVQTAACPGPADVYLAPKGRDRDACTRTAPCRTFARAYAAAEPGQTVQLAAGTYGPQRIPVVASRTSPDDVTFRPAEGAKVTIGPLAIAGSHVTVRDLRVAGDWAASATADDVTFRGVDVRGGIYIDSSRNVSIIGGAVGPLSDVHSQFAAWPVGTHIENVLVDGVTFHDARRSNEDVHIECLQIAGGVGVTVRNSRFVRCAVFDLSLTEYNGSGPPTDVVIENNVFGASVDGGIYSLHFNSNVTTLRNVLVRNNSSPQPFSLDGPPALEDVRVVANLAPLEPYACDERVAYDHNVWDGAACSETDTNAPSGFVDAASGDLRLGPASAAIDAGDPESHPARDRAGEPRPAGEGPDAGAYEAP